MRYKHVNFNKIVRYKTFSPTTGVGLSKLRDNTVTSPL